MSTSSMERKKRRLAELEGSLPAAVRDREIDELRKKKSRLQQRFKYAPTKRRGGYSSEQALRGEGGRELREFVKDLMESGMISSGRAALREYRVQFGKECPQGGPERRGGVSPKAEYRNWKTEVRTEMIGGKRKIVGYGAVFNQLSEPMRIGNRVVRERVMPGAFDKCLASKPDIRGLVNHDPNMILGRTTAGTMRVSVDSHGAKYEIDPPNTGYASDLIESLSRGDIDQSSFGFFTITDSYVPDDDGMIRELKEVECFDFSPVTFPAYTGASSGLRAAEEIR